MNSPKRLARIAGLLYLLVAIFGGFAQGFVYPKMYAAGDAATTAGNVVANAGLVRIGVVADLVQATVFVFLAITLYRLLKHVHSSAALAMVVLVAIATSITCLNAGFAFEGLQAATDKSYSDAVGTGGSNALVLLLFAIQHYGILIAQIFFGLWLVALGYLACTSGLFPKALGVVLIVGGVCLFLDMLAQFLVPDFGQKVSTFGMSSQHNVGGLPSAIAEVWMVGYLLVKGVKTPTQGSPAVGTGTQPSARAAHRASDSAPTDSSVR